MNVKRHQAIKIFLNSQTKNKLIQDRTLVMSRQTKQNKNEKTIKLSNFVNLTRLLRKCFSHPSFFPQANLLPDVWFGFISSFKIRLQQPTLFRLIKTSRHLKSYDFFFSPIKSKKMKRKTEIQRQKSREKTIIKYLPASLNRKTPTNP